MRFGLVGTGPWASRTHGPGLTAAKGVELVGVWGRHPEKTAVLAGELGVPGYDDYAERKKEEAEKKTKKSKKSDKSEKKDDEKSDEKSEEKPQPE